MNPKIVPMTSPYEDGDEIYVVPPLKPDVAIVHAQRADASGDAQIWGLLGCQKEAAFAAERVIVVVEEVVDESVIRADPNRTVIPGVVVDAVVEEPFGCHPSFAQGYYDRDNALLPGVGSDRAATPQRSRRGWTNGSTAWRTTPSTCEKWGREQWDRLRPGPAHVRPGRLREVRVSRDAARGRPRVLEVRDHDRGVSARQLAGARNCFVGVGLPNIVCNLAQRTVAPDLQLVYESGVFGARPERLPLSIGDPTLATGATAVTLDVRAVRLLPPGAA